MKNFWSKIKKERWHLHIVGGALITFIVLPLFYLLDMMDSLRWYETSLLFFTMGCVLGLWFEIIQSGEGPAHYKKYKKLYDWNIFAKHKTYVDLYDALFTGIGCLLAVPLLYWLAHLIF